MLEEYDVGKLNPNPDPYSQKLKTTVAARW